MSFLNNLVGEFTHSERNQRQEEYPPQQYSDQRYSAGPPQQQYHGGAGYSQQQYGGGYGSQEQRGEYYEQQPQKPDHSRRNMALAGVAGLAGGALLMHEGEEVSTYLSSHPSSVPGKQMS
jgi:hypothetical protein